MYVISQGVCLMATDTRLQARQRAWSVHLTLAAYKFVASSICNELSCAGLILVGENLDH